MSSPRRGGNEQSILEMLERDTGGAGGLQARSHFGWYVAGGALAVSLVGLLAWVAHESPKVQQAEAVLAAISTERAASAPAALDNNVADAAPVLAHAPGALPQHAAIVDEQQQSSRTHDAQDQLQLPPLVLAKPGVLGAVPPAQPTGGAVLQDEPAATRSAGQAPLAQAAGTQNAAEQAASPVGAAPQQAAVTSSTAAKQAAVTPSAASEQRTVTSSTAAKQAAVEPSAAAEQQLVTSSASAEQQPVAASAAAEQATATSSTAPGVTAQPPARQANADARRSRAAGKTAASTRANGRKLAKNSAKSKKPAVTGRTADTQVDSDVALISAVIQHTANRPEPPCADAKCAAKATPEP